MSEQSTNGPSEGAGSTSDESPQGDLPPPPPPPPPASTEAAVNAEVEEMWSKPLGPPATIPPPASAPESEPSGSRDDEAPEAKSSESADEAAVAPEGEAEPESAPDEASSGSGDVPWQVPNPTPPWSEEPAAPPPPPGVAPAPVDPAIQPPPPPAPPPAPADAGWAAQQDPAQQQWPADPSQQQWQQDPAQQQWQADASQQQWQQDPAQQQWQQDPAAQQQWQQDPAAAAQAYQQAPVAPPQVGSGQYPAYGYAQAQVPAPGYQAAPQAPQFVDPHGVGQAVNRLGSAGRRNGKMSFHILAALLDSEETVEVVEIIVAGRVRGVPGAAALVGNKVILVNERSWKPDVITVQLDAALQVQGWQDDRVASLMFAGSEGQEVIERVPDRLLAVEFAQRVRDRIANPV